MTPSSLRHGRRMWIGIRAMLPLIIISILAAVVAMIAYQYVIQKYYWGPKGPPKKNERDKDSGQG